MQSFCFRGFVSYCFRWMEGVIGDGKGKGERVERNRGRDGEKSMNYPYIISTLFVLVWVDSG